MAEVLFLLKMPVSAKTKVAQFIGSGFGGSSAIASAGLSVSTPRSQSSAAGFHWNPSPEIPPHVMVSGANHLTRKDTISPRLSCQIKWHRACTVPLDFYNLFIIIYLCSKKRCHWQPFFSHFKAVKWRFLLKMNFWFDKSRVASLINK